jgi:hypothetical protein
MIPSAWSAFLTAAETYFDMYGSVEGALSALHKGLDATERAEVRAYLVSAVAGDEWNCRAVTAITNPVLNLNSFIPERQMTRVSDPCLTFHRMALAAFEDA